MRDGVNPEKYSNKKNTRFLHRIIIPVYIPNKSEDYYIESVRVFKSCLNSIINSINPEITAISIVNNNSFNEINIFLEENLLNKKINKHIRCAENIGKVYAVISEAKASFEPFITIADADVYFIKGWETKIFELFNIYSRAGAISPVPSPNNCFYHNSTIFFDNYLIGKLKYQNKISENEFDFYLRGMNNPSLLNRENSKFSWKQKQYFLNKEKTAIAGACHFVATYRKEIFDLKIPFPELKFENGYEEYFLDDKVDRLGLYRLSTTENFAYHMGNRYEDIDKVPSENVGVLAHSLINSIGSSSKSIIPYVIRTFYFRVLKKIFKI